MSWQLGCSPRLRSGLHLPNNAGGNHVRHAAKCYATLTKGPLAMAVARIDRRGLTRPVLGRLDHENPRQDHDRLLEIAPRGREEHEVAVVGAYAHQLEGTIAVFHQTVEPGS